MVPWRFMGRAFAVPPPLAQSYSLNSNNLLSQSQKYETYPNRKSHESLACHRDWVSVKCTVAGNANCLILNSHCLFFLLGVMYRSSCKNPLLENTLHFLGRVLLYINSFLFLDALNSPSLIAELSGEVSRVANLLSRKVVCQRSR